MGVKTRVAVAPSSLRVAVTVMLTGVVGNEVPVASVIRNSWPPEPPTPPVGAAATAVSAPTLMVTVPVVAETFLTSAVTVDALHNPLGELDAAHSTGETLSATISMAPSDGACSTTAVLAVAVAPPVEVPLKVIVRFPAVTGPAPTGMVPVQFRPEPVMVTLAVWPLDNG